MTRRAIVVLAPLVWGACNGDTDTGEVLPPSAPVVSIQPDPATSSDDLWVAIEVESQDPGGRSVFYRYEWDNGMGGTAQGETLPAWQTRKGQTWRVVVTPANGVHDGPSGEASTTIFNSAPTIANVSILPGNPFANTDLRCNPEGIDDADDDPVTMTYAWTVDGVPVGETGQILAASHFQRYDEVVCTATPSDDEAMGIAVSSSPVVINNRPPTIVSVQVSPDDPRTDTTLTCTPTGWVDLDGDSAGYLFAWTVGGVDSGETDTLSGDAFHKGDAVICTVTPTDGADLGDPVASDPVLVGNTPPSLSAVSLDPDPAFTESVIECQLSGGSDLDGDLVSYLYTWTVGDEVAGGNEPFLYGVTDFDRGNVVKCAVAPSDGEDVGEVVTSDSLTIANTLPVTTSVTLTPDPADTNSFLTCVPSGTDADGDQVKFDYAWTVNGITKGGSFDTLSAANFQRGHVVICAATPRDTFGAGTALASDPLTIANAKPSITAVSIEPETAPSDSPVTCVPSGWSDPDGDGEGYHYAWTVNNLPAGGDSDTLAAEHFARGNAVICTVTPTDGTDDGTPVSSPARTISNGAPSITSVTVTPESPTTNTNLLCSVLGWSDPDGDLVSWDTAWTVNGEPAGENNSILPSANFGRGDEVVCTITPEDDEGATGEPFSIEPVVIGNTPPSISYAFLDPGSGTVTTTFTCVPFGWFDWDDDDPGYDFAWTVEGAPVEGDTDTLSGAFSKDEVVACTVTPDDGRDTGTPASTLPVTIGNTPPSITSVSISPGTAYADSTLTCVPEGWDDPDGDEPGYDYAWTVKNGAVGGNTSTLSGVFVGGDGVNCAATPKDDDAPGEAKVSDVLYIANTVPSITSVSISPETAYAGSTLTCVPAGWTDPDGTDPEYDFAWTVNETPVGDNASTLSVPGLKKDDQVVCTATPKDGVSSGTPVESGIRTISNSAPSITSVSISPETATTGSTLTCVPSGWNDPDGEEPAYDYAWTVDGDAAGDNADTLASSNFVRGQSVVCFAAPKDSETTGEAVESPPRTIGDSAPSITSVSITPDPAYADSTLTCVPSGWDDPDGDEPDYDYAWEVGGSAAGGNTSTLTSGFAKGQSVSCTATPKSGDLTGTAVESDPRTISNTVPSITSVSITPATAYADSTLTCVPTGWSDADGEEPTYDFAWTVGGVAAGGNSATLTSGFAKGQNVVCSATPKDSDTTGTTKESDPRTISNSAPSITSVSITPTTAYTDSTLTCVPSGWDDADEDDPGYHYAWTVEGDPAGTDAETLDSSAFAQTDVVVCAVTPDDGTATGEEVSSPGRTISNRAPSTPVVAIDAYPEAGADDLVCAITTAATDADGDTVTTTIEWLLDGNAWEGGTSTTTHAGDTIAAGDIHGCDAWQCRAVASDGFDQTTTDWDATLANSAHGIGDLTAARVGLPDQGDSLTAALTFGYWFEVPGDLTVVGLSVPTDASTDVQNIEIVRFDAAPYAQTNAFERLACFRGVTDDRLETDPIDLFAGEFIGVLGARGTGQMANSLGSSPWASAIGERGTTLNGLLMIGNLHDQLSKDLGNTSSGLGRVELRYESHDTCPQASGQVDLWGNLAAYGGCWYVGAGGASCDEVCAAVGGQNLADWMDDAWSDTCAATAGADDVTTMFYDRGMAAYWINGAYGPGTGAPSLGYGYLDGSYVGKCAAGTFAAVGTYPGETATSDTRTLVCPCHRRQTFGPVHTFGGQESTHFATQYGCSPSGDASNVDADAAYFCRAFYGPTCAPRTGYAAETENDPDAWRMLIGTAQCGDTDAISIPGTDCPEGACQIWLPDVNNQSTNGIGNLVCDCN